MHAPCAETYYEGTCRGAAVSWLTRRFATVYQFTSIGHTTDVDGAKMTSVGCDVRARVYIVIVHSRYSVIRHSVLGDSSDEV